MNGTDRYIIFNAAPIRNSRGKLLAVIETFEDVTERKHYEEQFIPGQPRQIDQSAEP